MSSHFRARNNAARRRARKNPPKRGAFGVFETLPTMEAAELLTNALSNVPAMLEDNSDFPAYENYVVLDAFLQQLKGYSILDRPEDQTDEQLAADVDEVRQIVKFAVLDSIAKAVG